MVNPEALLKAIEKRGVKQCKLAKAMGVSRMQFYRISRNMTAMTVDQMTTMIRFLHLNKRERKDIFGIKF